MNKKECPKCQKVMVTWGSQGKDIWKCGCGHEEDRKSNLPSGEELFKKKWEEANKIP